MRISDWSSDVCSSDLPESSERLPVAGKVVWVTPTGAQGNRKAGVGVQFADTPEGDTVKGRIENLIAGALGADKTTNTMYPATRIETATQERQKLRQGRSRQSSPTTAKTNPEATKDRRPR